MLDYLNTPAAYQPYARKQLLDWNEHCQRGSIFRADTTRPSVMLRKFLYDVTLEDMLTSKEGGPQVSDILPDGLNGPSRTRP